MRALIAEDNPSSRSLYFKWMESFFDEVDIVSDGSQAVSIFLKALMDRNPYSFVVMDLMMPEMNGYDVIREFRILEEEYSIENSLPSKIVVVSGIEKKDFIISALKEVCDYYIEKPVKKAVLTGIIEGVVSCKN
ncbi:MAG: response regulator [Desulfobacteraceae bacterium]|nr:response regulator [Desulfobacteraceae bacterium]MCB9494773.1 response regulator [Desulfobacteraceae bacterium]